MKILQNISIIILTLIFAQSCHTDKKSEINTDGIDEIPEWLKLNVDEALPLDSLNIWIPTNNFQSSSLLRVPRFPRKFSNLELEENEVLKDFEIYPISDGQVLELRAVKNEQISAQLAIGAKQDLKSVRVEMTELSSKGNLPISRDNLQIRYVKYLAVERSRSEYEWSPKLESIVDEGTSGNLTPSIVGDPLIKASSIDVPAYRAQPIWFTIKIPKNTRPGLYRGDIRLFINEIQEMSFPIKLTVLNQEIPDYSNYQFLLDMWVNPSAIAEYYKLEHWSEKHWIMIEKYLKEYAMGGGKNIATTITHEPWHKPWLNGTTHSQIAFGYRSMVNWIMNEDVSWSFDYSVFDKYVEIATNVGITGAINAFSMTPFHTKQKIHYTNKKDGTHKILDLNIEDQLYSEVWSEFLKSFKNHLIAKGWYDRTYLGFDEKPEDVILILKGIIKSSAPEFLDRIVIAGHPETGVHAQNCSISYMFFPGQPLESKAVVPVMPTVKQRNEENKTTSFYLCAEPAHPNTLTYSPAIEAQLIPWLALKYEVNGYLRWAYNNWTEDPFTKPVFIHAQGDDYQIYPGDNGPVSSIRWELLKEGIEDYELFKIIEQQNRISSEKLHQAIELATRNQDGRFKRTDDFIKARRIILGEQTRNSKPGTRSLEQTQSNK